MSAFDQLSGWPVEFAAAGVTDARSTLGETGDVDRPQPWASVTKLVTSYGVLRLLEVGELDLRSEAEVCQYLGIAYFSYPIPDHHVPPFSDDTLALLEQLRDLLAQGKHVVAHCHMGLGRSALIAACVLVLSGLTPERACQELSAVRGYNVPETEEQRAWVRAFPRRYRERQRARDNAL